MLQYALDAAGDARIDCWDGRPAPLIICEARSTTGFPGVLQADGYRGFDGLYATGRIAAAAHRWKVPWSDASAYCRLAGYAAPIRRADQGAC
jgi:hypothetical protein